MCQHIVYFLKHFQRVNKKLYFLINHWRAERNKKLYGKFQSKIYDRKEGCNFNKDGAFLMKTSFSISLSKLLIRKPSSIIISIHLSSVYYIQLFLDFRNLTVKQFKRLDTIRHFFRSLKSLSSRLSLLS